MASQPRTVEACLELLKSRKWSAEDNSYRREGRLVWVVLCQRGKEQIVAEGATQLEAWQTAVEAT